MQPFHIEPVGLFNINLLFQSLVHKITILCSKNGIPVYKNEHDGLITGKEIPDALIKQAAKKANMPTPVFEIKSICSDAKRDKTIKFLGKEQVSELIQ